MPIEWTCECGKRLRLRDELAGKKVRCPACGQTLTAATPGLTEVNSAEVSLPRRRVPRESTFSTMVTCLIVAGAFAVLAFSALAMAVLLTSGLLTSQPAPLVK